MSKYFSGLVAALFAICMIAFKPADRVQSTKLFRYNPPATNPFSKANVEDRSNWQMVTGTQQCPLNTNQKACELEVLDSPSYINGDNTLATGFAIVAAEFASDVHFVTSIPSGAGSIHNKPL